MTQQKLSTLQETLEQLQARKKEAEATTHPSANVDDSTTDNVTGATGSEKSQMIAEQQPTGVENAEAPVEEPSAGSLGVEATSSEEAPAGSIDTSGVSEAANTGTTHPSAKAASDLLSELEALPVEEDETSKEASDKNDTAEDGATAKTAAEELQEYTEKVAAAHPEEVEAGYKFAAAVLQDIAKLAMDPAAAAMMGGEGAPAPAAAPGLEELDASLVGAEDPVAALQAALAEAGITPEELAAALAGEEAGVPAAPVEDPAAPKVAAEQVSKTAGILKKIVGKSE